jgi:hypothetical protein
MKKITFLIMTSLICILNVKNLYSQTNFQSGYIIDLKKDTIKGLINYYNWQATPKSITFKTLVDNKEITYKSANIYGFSIDGERYISGIVTIDVSSFKYNELNESDKPEYKTDTVFLQILVDGRKSLFSLKDENLRMHFFINTNGIYETLFFRQYLQNVNGIQSVKTNEKFKGQLIVYFQDCPLIKKKVYNVLYNSKDLIDLYNEYYKLTNSQIIYKYKLEKYKFKSEFGLFGGISLTNIKFSGVDLMYSSELPILQEKFTSSTNYVLGAFFNIVIPRAKSKISYKSIWSIHNELIYTSYKFNGHWLDYTNENIYTDWNSTIGTSFIKLNNLLEFKYPIKKIYFVLDGGISNGYPYSEKNHIKGIEHIYSDTYKLGGPGIDYFNKWESGSILGLGINYKNLLFEFRIEKTNGIKCYEITSKVTRTFLLLRYKF